MKARKAPATVSQYMGFARAYRDFCKGKSFDTPQDAVCSYLTSFSVNKKSIAHQKGALNALAGKSGLYVALGEPLGRLPIWVNAKRIETVPVWVTRAEAEAIAGQLSEPWALMVMIMFGAGLRVGEVVGLRWKDLDFERNTITVHQGKGNKDRITFLPQSLKPMLRERYRRCRALWREDRMGAMPGVSVPQSCENKSPKCGEDWPFFWVFPAAGESVDKVSGIKRRHHVHKKSISKALRPAVRRSGVAKRVVCHSFRHGFATAYLLAGGVLTELRDLLGHKSIQTTEIYAHCVPDFMNRVGSPLDCADPAVDDAVIPFAASARAEMVDAPMRKFN